MAEDRNPTRRRVLTLVSGATALTVMLPTKWTKPIVESIVVPAHAQASRPRRGTGTTNAPPTTSIPPTTSAPPPTTLD